MNVSIKIKRLVPLLALFFSSCIGNLLFDDVQKINPDGWNEKDIIKFQAPVNDISSSYNIYLHLRNSNDYEYSNLWLFISTISPGSNRMTDTVEFILADPTGQWLGKGLGSINTSLIPYKQNIRFPQRGIYTFEIKQGMRKEVLDNILDVGIRIEPVN
jgi:gliding motility-associated lipoprotein GldH